VETQSFAEHEATAMRLGLCSRPGTGCKGYYYGGIDLAPPWDRLNEDIPVWASAGGKATVQDQRGSGYGLHVRLEAEGSETVIFGHLQRATVSSGQWVTQGTQVGWMGNTGNSTGKHVHWEIRQNGIPVDPMTRLAGSAPTEPEPEAPVEEEEFFIPALPKLPIVQVSAEVKPWLNVRIEPKASSRDIGNVYANEMMGLISAQRDAEGNVWYLALIMGRPLLVGWVAARWKGETWIRAL